jgi:hypothetical protein
VVATILHSKILCADAKTVNIMVGLITIDQKGKNTKEVSQSVSRRSVSLLQCLTIFACATAIFVEITQKRDYYGKKGSDNYLYLKNISLRARQNQG